MGEYEYLVQLVQKGPMPTYGSDVALEGILAEFHYMDYCLDTHALAPFDVHELTGWREQYNGRVEAALDGMTIEI